MRRAGKYDNYTASDLARETRARGLEKPNVITLREWADWLEAHDKAAEAETPEPTAWGDTPQPNAHLIPPVNTTAEIAPEVRRAALESMSVRELREDAEQRGLNRKDELIDAIEAAQGVSEAEQAQADGINYEAEPFDDDTAGRGEG